MKKPEFEVIKLSKEEELVTCSSYDVCYDCTTYTEGCNLECWPVCNKGYICGDYE